MKEKLGQGGDVLAGLAFMAKNNFIHKDIKLANVLFKREKDHTISTHVSDLAGAKQLTNKGCCKSTDHDKFSFGVHTSSKTSKAHLSEAKKEFFQGNIDKSNKILLENDVFAAGILLYEFLTKKKPCVLDDDGYVKEIDFKKNEFSKEVPQAIIELIKKMLTGKPGEKSITMEQASQEYDKVMNPK